MSINMSARANPISIEECLKRAQNSSRELQNNPELSSDQVNFLYQTRKDAGDGVVACAKAHMESLVKGADYLSGQNSYSLNTRESIFVRNWSDARRSGNPSVMKEIRGEVVNRYIIHLTQSRSAAKTPGEKARILGVVDSVSTAKWGLIRETAYAADRVIRSMEEVEKVMINRASPGSIAHSHSTVFPSEEAAAPALGNSFSLAGNFTGFGDVEDSGN